MTNPIYDANGTVLLHGNVLDCLKEMQAASVHTVVTSPPYWGLRKYEAVEPSVWGGEPECEHVWGDGLPGDNRGGSGTPNGRNGRGENYARAEGRGCWCQRCSAWRGTLGNEPTLAQYVQNIVSVFSEVWRVLRDDSVAWLNLGDSYYAGGSTTENGQNTRLYEANSTLMSKYTDGQTSRPVKPRSGELKNKDLCGIPWRVAFALQDSGWYLRSDVIWAKGASYCDSWAGSVMPESVTDRPTSAHEYVFLLAKSTRYFYDVVAVREDGVDPERQRADRIAGANGHNVRHSYGGIMNASTTRNLRNVWAISPAPSPFAHFATFPPKLVEPMIRAGTSAHGACDQCGAPWERVTLNSPMEVEPGPSREALSEAGEQRSCNGTMTKPPETTTIGWRPTCACRTIPEPEPKPPKFVGNAQSKREQRQAWLQDVWLPWWQRIWPVLQTWPTQPCVVLDPFVGSGTTALVARAEGRHAIGIDASETYLRTITIPRLQAIDLDALLPDSKPTARAKTTDPRQLALFDG